MHYRNFKKNRGRGFIRKQAVIDCNSELLLFLDSTNVLPKEFCSIAQDHFNDELVCAASGVIKNHESVYGISTRWRSRHLFKSEMTYNNFHNTKSLTTYGTILRRPAVLDVGNFDPTLRHSEDKDLGIRLLNNGYKIIGDPNLVVYSIKKDSILSVLERYWRWYGGEDEIMSFYDYLISIKASIRPMIQQDIMAYDLKSALISFLCPHYGYCRYLFRKLTGRIQKSS